MANFNKLDPDFVERVKQAKTDEKQSMLSDAYIDLVKIKGMIANDLEITKTKLQIERLATPYNLITKQNNYEAALCHSENDQGGLIASIKEEIENKKNREADDGLANAKETLKDLMVPYKDEEKNAKAKIEYILLALKE
jgi:hypothetical protein